MTRYSEHIISCGQSIGTALEKINDIAPLSPLVLFVMDSTERIVGSLTDGDIRRGLLAGLDLSSPVERIAREDFRYIDNINDYEKINDYKAQDLKIIPLITENGHLVRFIDLTKYKAWLPIDAVIMAGGKGVRLKPYTNDIPKPMLDLAGKPIIARNIDRLLKYGVRNIYISVNHMREQIMNYVCSTYSDQHIHFIEEDKPLGTIGALSRVSSWEHDDILVMNADILTNIDFYDFFVNYKKHHDDLSVATFNVRINVPYGILDVSDKQINDLIEKPSYTYYSIAGIYLMSSCVTRFIPQGTAYDATDLIEKLISEHKRVTHFPIRGYWLDIGNAQNYAKAQDDINFIKD